MTRLVRLAAAWGFFWLGHCVSRTIEPALGRWFEWPYYAYARLMGCSAEWQGDLKGGPWGSTQESKS